MFDTEFWKMAKIRGETNIKESLKNKKFLEMIQYSKYNNPDISAKEDYGTWWLGSFYQNFHNLDLYEKINKLQKNNFQ